MSLRSQKFREEREADWRSLERLLDLFEHGRTAQINNDEVVAIPVLYRSALSSLSTARAVSLDQSLIAYLEGLWPHTYHEACVFLYLAGVYACLSIDIGADQPAIVTQH